MVYIYFVQSCAASEEAIRSDDGNCVDEMWGGLEAFSVPPAVSAWHTRDGRRLGRRGRQSTPDPAAAGWLRVLAVNQKVAPSLGVKLGELAVEHVLAPLRADLGGGVLTRLGTDGTPGVGAVQQA